VRKDAYEALQVLGPDGKDALPALQRALKHKQAAERTRAVLALTSFGPDCKEARDLLLDLARNDKDLTNRRRAMSALPRLQPASADIRPLLHDALNDVDPVLRLMAADWLWHLDPKDPRPLKIVVSSLTETGGAFYGFQILQHRHDPGMAARPVLTELLGHKNYTYRLWAIQTLDRLGVDSKEHQQKLVAALNDPEGLVRVAAARALRKVGVAEKAAVASLVKSLAARDKFSLSYATALAEYGPAAKSAIPLIEREMPVEEGYWRLLWIEALLTIDPDQMPKWKATLEDAFVKEGNASAAAELLCRHFPKETKYRDFLVEQLQSFESRTRIRAALALEKVEPKKHKIVPVLIEALRGPPAVDARIAAAVALATVGPAAMDAVPALRVALCDTDTRVRQAANEALWRIDPKSAMPCVFQGY
jgi:HEAT repeat protein